MHASELTWLTWFQQEEEDRREDERRRERQRERERQQRQEQEEEERRRSAAARQKSREEEQRQRNRKRRNESSSDSDSSRSGHNLSPIVLTNLITLLVYFFGAINHDGAVNPVSFKFLTANSLYRCTSYSLHYGST